MTPAAPQMVRRNYAYRIYPTRWQQGELDRQLRLCCDIWNAALEHRTRMWRDHHQSIGFVEQSRQLTEARRELPWLATMNALAQHEVLRRLDRAFQAFFRRTKAGESPGYPRYRSFARFDSITWAKHRDGCRAEHGKRLYLQGVGPVKVRWHRPIPATARVTQVSVQRRASGWYTVLCLELPAPATLPPTGQDVGVDVGVTTFAALSTGELIPGPRARRAAEKALHRSQRNVSRKRKGSNRREACRQLARAHERVHRQRKDHAHKTARELVDRFDLIAIEDLRVPNMTRSARGTTEQPGTNVRAKAGLNRSILDAAWSQFTRLLEEKATTAGRQVIRVPAAHTSQTCHECGSIDARNRRTQALFTCIACGHTAHADTNAAKNILRSARGPAWRTANGRSDEAKTRPTLGTGSRPPQVTARVGARIPSVIDSVGLLLKPEPDTVIAADRGRL